MPGKWKLLLNCKNAHACAVAALLFNFARQNERRLGKIRLARERLHLARRQSTSIGEDRRLIAFQGPVSKHIHEYIWQTTASDTNHMVILIAALDEIGLQNGATCAWTVVK